ncbi:MAG: FG-GAP repeat protein [Desulfobacteria bacterium]
MKLSVSVLLMAMALSAGLLGCYEEEAKIVDNYWYGNNNMYNGWAVAIDGNYAAIGNPQGYNVYNFKTGSVYIAERKNGDWLANPDKIAPTNLNNNDFFGCSIGMSGGRLIIGANHRQEAYVYQRYSALGNDNLWYEQDRLRGADVATGDSFGLSVAISGDWAIVGSPYDDNGKGTNAGSAYLFQLTGSDWVQRKKILASDGASGDIFGWAVAISGDYAVVGAPSDDNQRGANAGGIYVFGRSGTNWVQVTKQIASDGGVSDCLGWSVAINANYILAGAHYNDNHKGPNAGAAYFFVRNGSSYNQKMKLVATDGTSGDQFGRSVALTEYFAAIGAPYDDHSLGTNAGATYIYYRSGDELAYVEKRSASDGAEGDLFGFQVAMSGDYAVFSALYDDNSVGGDAGSAYIFERKK